MLAQLETKIRQLHKFGGSSLANARCYLRVADIMAKYSMPGDIIIVSAAGNTTNQLIDLFKLSQIDRFSAYRVQKLLHHYQKNLIADLIPIKKANNLIDALVQDIEKLTKLLDNPVTDVIYAEVVGQGEIWSARLMAAVLKQQGLEAVWLDAREFLRAERTVQPQINAALSYSLLHRLLVQYSNKRIVITGFISRNNAGETVLLGRNGSDYSATQIGVLAGASRITIWSDVAGVYSADPRKVKDAHLLPLLRLDEANELARLAAPILHTRTLQPIFSNNIDLQLRCSYFPDQDYTCIRHVLTSGTGLPRIVTSHDDICLIEFKVFNEHHFWTMQRDINFLLKRAQIQPLAVGVHKNRHLLQFCYTSEIAYSALDIIDKAGFSGYLRLRQGMALIAMIGAGITRNLLQSHRLWRQLRNQPIEFIWQSEKNISLAVVLSNNNHTENLIQKLHDSLFHAENILVLCCLVKPILILAS